MKIAAVGCLIGLGGWLLLAAAISWWLQAHGGLAGIDTTGPALVAGLAGWVALSFARSAWQGWAEQRAIAGGVAGVPPRDGAKSILVGAIEPLGATLRAPLDNAVCVTYRYAVTEITGSGKHRMSSIHFKGHGLVPSCILTKTGRHLLLAVPDLESADTAPTHDRSIASFERYARDTVFTTGAGASQALMDRWTDADGAFRSDVACTPLAEVTLNRCHFVQQHIRPHALVCVIGTYSAAQGGIVPASGLGDSPRLIEGGAGQVMATLRRTMWTRTAVALVCASACAGVLLLFGAPE